MAIYHLSTQPLSRNDGRSAVAAAAYRSGSELADVRTGQVFDYTRKGGVMSAEIVVPEGVAVPAREALWNAAEAAEKRKDARVAREWRAALPAELSDDERRGLAREFGQYIADRFGVAVDVCVHAPDRDGDERNFHVHMLATTRQIEADGSLGKKAAFELGNKDRQRAGIPGTTQQELVEVRAHWAELTNRALERAGYQVRVDHRSFAAQGIDLTPSRHVGVHATAMDRRGVEAERVAEHDDVRRDNAAKIEERPALILEKITQMQAVFDRRDIARELNRYIDDPQQFQNLMARLESAPELVQLAPEMREGGRTVPAKFTTREMIEAERAMIDHAERLAGSASHAVPAEKVAATADRYDTLSDEQRAAVEHVTGAGRLAVIIGDAGTGKSFAMRVAKEAWEAEGYRVRGCALAGKAADELQAGSGIESRTIHSLEHAWKRGKDPLTSRDVLVIDEAGMVGSRQLGRVLEAAEKAGAKVVMLGDDKQLAAIEAGAGFRAITERVGAAEITQIRRQREDWAREASAEFARGDVRAGLDAYHQRGRVRMVDDRDAAKAALAADWLADREKGGSSIILAHTNADVRDLNETIRQARQQAGELGQSAEFAAERGRRDFAEGDRLVFLKNDGALGVKNGTLGTVERAEDGRLAVRLDDGRDVAFSADQYAHVDHGYAVTVHKAQGVTVDRAYVLASSGMDRNLAYVGMTRHREAATLYAGRDDFGSYDKLARGLARQQPKASTLDFAESTYGFADRRDFDGAGVVGRWIERGREKLAELGGRAKAALHQAFERAGIRRDVPDLAQATPEAVEALRRPQERPEPQPPADTEREKARAAIERAFGYQVERPAPAPEDPQARVLDKLRADAAAAERKGDELGRIVAEGKLAKAEELAKAGEPLTHHAMDIEKAGQQAMQQWAAGQRAAMTPEEAKRAAARAEIERAMGGRPAPQQEQPGLSEREKARAAIEKAMGKGQKRDRGIDFD